MVPDVADLLRVANLAGRAAAHADRPHRVVVHDPVDHVEIVDVLLDDVVAAHPQEVVPVVDLVGAVRLAVGAVAEPDALAVPRAAGRDDVADRPVVDLA